MNPATLKLIFRLIAALLEAGNPITDFIEFVEEVIRRLETPGDDDGNDIATVFGSEDSNEIDELSAQFPSVFSACETMGMGSDEQVFASAGAMGRGRILEIVRFIMENKEEILALINLIRELFGKSED